MITVRFAPNTDNNVITERQRIVIVFGSWRWNINPVITAHASALTDKVLSGRDIFKHRTMWNCQLITAQSSFGCPIENKWRRLIWRKYSQSQITSQGGPKTCSTCCINLIKDLFYLRNELIKKIWRYSVYKSTTYFK